MILKEHEICSLKCFLLFLLVPLLVHWLRFSEESVVIFKKEKRERGCEVTVSSESHKPWNCKTLRHSGVYVVSESALL